ncbi:hypothetical protein SH528x_006397 [Novipirellula sp. SH528]|uniref:hypothetical protein n=1 Tax=Novipirellula sp. SH528 TaxID=3454466 RepID=UPI003FA0C352
MKKNPKIVLVFNGPDYAEECLEDVETYLVDISPSEAVARLTSHRRLWGNSSAARISWCEQDEYDGKTIFVPTSNPGSLSILFHREHGFHFRHDIEGKKWIAISLDMPKRVEQLIGSELGYFPSNTYFSIEDSTPIVSAFASEERRYTGVEWVEADNFNCHDPYAWEKLVATMN